MAKKKLGKPRRHTKTVLQLPDLDHAKSAVLNSLSSAAPQRGYRHAIDEFIKWYCSEPRREFTLPYMLVGITVIVLFLVARLLFGRTLDAAEIAAKLHAMPYQRGQFWIRRFRNLAANSRGAPRQVPVAWPGPETSLL